MRPRPPRPPRSNPRSVGSAARPAVQRSPPASSLGGTHAAVLVATRRRAGQARGLVGVVVGLLLTLVLGARHHPARVRHRPGQLPQQVRSGLQGQRRLPGPVRRPGHAHRHHDGRGPHGRRALHRRRASSSSTEFARRRSTESRPDPRRDHPAHRARVRRQPRAPARTATRPTASPAGALQRALEAEEPRVTGGRGPLRRRHHDAGAAERRSRGGADPRQPRVGQVPALRQPGRHPHLAAPVLPGHRRTPRSSSACRGNEDIETEGAAAQLVQDEAAKFDFPNADDRHHRRRRSSCGTSTTTCGAACSPSAPSPSAIMVLILLVLLQRALAPAAPGGDPHRRHLGLRPGRLPRASR